MILLIAMIGCDWVMDNFEGSDKKIAELPLMINQIKEAQLANYDLLQFYVDAEPYPKTPSSVAQPWIIAESGGFTTIAWSPGNDASVYGSYAIKVSEDGSDFTVIGVSDIDGDGVFATYTATKDTDPKRTTDQGIY